MEFNGYGFSGYRSVSDTLVKISPINKINLIIGRNNVGKSNLINFLVEHYSNGLFDVKNKHHKKLVFNDSLDTSKIKSTFRISFPIYNDDLDDYIAQKFPDNLRGEHASFALKKLLTSGAFCDETGTT